MFSLPIYYTVLNVLFRIIIERNTTWKNPRRSGQKKKKSEKESWETNVPCQRFFKVYPGDRYFRVNSIRASPARTSRQSRTEISRRENSSDSSDDEDDDSDLPEGIYLFRLSLLTLFIIISLIFAFNILKNFINNIYRL